jgi:hypothetical protein
MIPGYVLLAKRIRDEIAELEQSVGRVNRAWQAAVSAETDQVTPNITTAYCSME